MQIASQESRWSCDNIRQIDCKEVTPLGFRRAASYFTTKAPIPQDRTPLNSYIPNNTALKQIKQRSSSCSSLLVHSGSHILVMDSSLCHQSSAKVVKNQAFLFGSLPYRGEKKKKKSQMHETAEDQWSAPGEDGVGYVLWTSTGRHTHHPLPFTCAYMNASAPIWA